MIGPDGTPRERLWAIGPWTSELPIAAFARPHTNAPCHRRNDALADLAADPYTPVAPREALTDHVTFAFVGGGFAGLVVGARLKQAGIEDVRIVEKGGDFGGTWLLPRIVGAGRARDLYLRPRPVDAVEALAIGLVSAVADDAVDLAGEPVDHA